MTDWDGFQARVHPGDGVIARTAGGALVLPRYNADQQQTVDRLLGLLRDAKPGGGRQLARKLAAILAADEGDDAVDVALLAPLAGGDVAVLVVGDIDIHAETADGSVSVSGRNALTWVDQVLRAPTAVRAGTPTGAPPIAISDLTIGIVPGSGLSLGPRQGQLPPDLDAKPAPQRKSAQDITPGPPSPGPAPDPVPPGPAPDPLPPGPAPEPPPPPMPPPGPPGPPTPVPTPLDFEVESLTDETQAPRPPLPVDEGEAPLPAGSVPAQVKGVYCKRGHFNDPMVQFCTVCGINMVQQTPALVDGPRPPLGVLVFDDGAVFQLEQDYVLGRQPEGSPEVQSGSAQPLRLEDSGGTISRAHALIALEDWSVRLSDHGSANGTYIAMPGSPDWQPVPPNGRVVLTPGTTIKLGNRTLKYESHRGSR